MSSALGGGPSGRSPKKLPEVPRELVRTPHPKWDHCQCGTKSATLGRASWSASCSLSRYTKGGDPNGNPAKERTRGLLGRLDLRVASTVRIGKEIDRLDEDDGTTLDYDQPIMYGQDDPGITWSALDVVARMPRKEAAKALGSRCDGSRTL